MNPTDKMMAWAQIALSFLFIGGVFFISAIYELGFAHLNAEQSRDFAKCLDWMQITCGAIIFFWFNRTRTGGIPDASQTVTQKITAPDGTTTTVVSPANAKPESVPTLATTSNTPVPLVPTPPENPK